LGTGEGQNLRCQIQGSRLLFQAVLQRAGTVEHRLKGSRGLSTKIGQEVQESIKALLRLQGTHGNDAHSIVNAIHRTETFGVDHVWDDAKALAGHSKLEGLFARVDRVGHKHTQVFQSDPAQARISAPQLLFEIAADCSNASGTCRARCDQDVWVHVGMLALKDLRPQPAHMPDDLGEPSALRSMLACPVHRNAEGLDSRLPELARAE
jgi:hypothetical protein